MESAGRTGMRQGKVSELTRHRPIRARRSRAAARGAGVAGGNFDDTDRVGTVHDMRFVFLDNDTKLLFATAYDGDWDPYIEDFATKIPDEMDVVFPPVKAGRDPQPQGERLIVKHQIPAEGWYVAHPDLTVRDIRRLKRVSKAVDEFLDKVAG